MPVRLVTSRRLRSPRSRPQQRAYLVIALDGLSVLKVPVVVKLIHDVSLLHP